MASFNVGSIADMAYNRIDSVPSAVSGTVMKQFAEVNVYRLESWTGNSIGTTSIGQTYLPFLVSMTVAETLARMHGVGADFNWSLGEFSVSKGKSAGPETLQVELALETAKNDLLMLPRKRVFGKSFG